MRRVLLVFTAMAVMAAMVAAMAVPAFAGGGGTKDPCKHGDNISVIDCRGGFGTGGSGGGGGGGGNSQVYPGTWDYSSHGGGGGSGGGSGSNCSGNFFGPEQCVGKGFSGKPA